MKTISVNIFKFSELSEESKQKALESLWDLNVGHEWWESVYDDAKTIGLEITEFDTYKREISGSFNISANEAAQNILNHHGETCNTHKTAENFLDKWNPVFAEYMDESSEKYESMDSENDLQDLEDGFLYDLKQDYLSMLEKEYEYLTSKAAIIESIEANDYDFTENGQLY